MVEKKPHVLLDRSQRHKDESRKEREREKGGTKHRKKGHFIAFSWLPNPVCLLLFSILGM